MIKLIKINLKKISSRFLIFVPFVFILNAFNFKDNPESNGWVLQSITVENGVVIGNGIVDVVFTDSLTGYIVTSGTSTSDTCFLLKTTNGGYNWSTKIKTNFPFQRVFFCDKNIGYSKSFQTLFKTSNAGENWSPIYLGDVAGEDMFVLNKDTLFMASSNQLVGGLFRSINGGQSWTQQYFGYANPDAIYMVNGKLGFMKRGSTPQASYIARTTDGGFNWTFTTTDSSYSKIFFIDSLTGWRTYPLKKTTDGGITWFPQFYPIVSTWNNILFYISVINKDTIFGSGGSIKYGTSYYRGIIYKTTNGGINWRYQIPDTSFGFLYFNHIKFINEKTGWAFWNNTKGIHTTTGGDSLYVGIKEISKNIPENFKLYQNYPNPFNPITKIRFEIPNRLSSPARPENSGNGFIGDPITTLKIYDLLGKEVAVLVNEPLHSGTYEFTFNGINLSSGTYFYKLTMGNLSETKKMLMIK